MRAKTQYMDPYDESGPSYGRGPAFNHNTSSTPWSSDDEDSDPFNDATSKWAAPQSTTKSSWAKLATPVDADTKLGPDPDFVEVPVPQKILDVDAKPRSKMSFKQRYKQHLEVMKVTPVEVAAGPSTGWTFGAEEDEILAHIGDNELPNGGWGDSAQDAVGTITANRRELAKNPALHGSSTWGGPRGAPPNKGSLHSYLHNAPRSNTGGQRDRRGGRKGKPNQSRRHAGERDDKLYAMLFENMAEK